MLNSASVYFTKLKFNLFDKLRNILFMLQIRKTEGGRERCAHIYKNDEYCIILWSTEKSLRFFNCCAQKKSVQWFFFLGYHLSSRVDLVETCLQLPLHDGFSFHIHHVCVWVSVRSQNVHTKELWITTKAKYRKCFTCRIETTKSKVHKYSLFAGENAVTLDLVSVGSNPECMAHK